jgi:KDO2-lipid IV(A) lauroyltransferase
MVTYKIMQSAKYSLKHRIEYIALTVFIRIINGLSLRLALYVGWGIGYIYFRIPRYRTAKALQRIKEVLGDSYSDLDRRRIAWLSLRNISFNLIEFIRFRSLTPETIRKQPLFRVVHEIQSIYSKQGTHIIAVPHAGNWEFASAALALSGLPCVVIVKRQKNLLVDTLINGLRTSVGLEVIYNDSKAMKRVIAAMKQGKILLILPDSHSRTESPKVNFLGKEANLGIGAAYFARKIGCPIYPIFLSRQGWSSHHHQIFDHIYPDHNQDKYADIQRMMQELMSIFDREIRKKPEQYLWFNKRWVLDPAWNNQCSG